MAITPKLDGNTPIEDILESFREMQGKEKETKANLKNRENQDKKS